MDEQRFADYFCERYVTKSQRAVLAVKGASSDPAWTATVADAREKYARRMSRWHVERESTRMQDLWTVFCGKDGGSQSDPTTEESVRLVRAEGSEVRSVEIRYRLHASFYACGSCNVGDQSSSDFKGTLVGPPLSLQDYQDIIACVAKGEDERFEKILDDVHDVLYEFLSPDAEVQWAEIY